MVEFHIGFRQPVLFSNIPEPFKESLKLFDNRFFLCLAVSSAEARYGRQDLVNISAGCLDAASRVPDMAAVFERVVFLVVMRNFNAVQDVFHRNALMTSSGFSLVKMQYFVRILRIVCIMHDMIIISQNAHFVNPFHEYFVNNHISKEIKLERGVQRLKRVI